MSDPLFADGVIVVDKPVGPTSHDVVAVMRRVLRGSRSAAAGARNAAMKVGHTGTLDPLASGVLPLVLGKATRLAQFLAGAAKAYEADIELGAATTTLDRSGQIVSRTATRTVEQLTRADIDEALAAFQGTYLQQPPAYSAKKIAGDRAYDLARSNTPVTLKPVEVTVTSLDVLEWYGRRLRIRLVCSAGFYVRSLAHSIGEHLGTGAHLTGLVRTRSGSFTLEDAVGLDVLDRQPAEAAARVIPIDRLLPELPALTLTSEGASRAARGALITAAHLRDVSQMPAGRVKLLHPDGHLVAIAEPSATGHGRVERLLHPGVVLD